MAIGNMCIKASWHEIARVVCNARLRYASLQKNAVFGSDAKISQAEPEKNFKYNNRLASKKSMGDFINSRLHAK